MGRPHNIYGMIHDLRLQIRAFYVITQKLWAKDIFSNRGSFKTPDGVVAFIFAIYRM